MEADFEIINTSKFPIKDVEIRCTHSGKSGTVIDSNERVVYESWKPGETKSVKGFNMGFIHDQAVKSGAAIKAFTAVLPGKELKVPKPLFE